MGVLVGGSAVLVGGTGVFVGGTGVLVGGTGVFVGGTGVSGLGWVAVGKGVLSGGGTWAWAVEPVPVINKTVMTAAQTRIVAICGFALSVCMAVASVRIIAIRGGFARR
jgi:hypothetical protein